MDEAGDEEVVTPTRLRGKRKPLPADLPRIEVVHGLPEHELTCACGCRKHAIGEKVSAQLEIVPMQIRVIKHVRKVYGCRDCESAPVTSDKPVQMIEKSMASPSVLAMLLTTKNVDELPLHRFEKVLGAPRYRYLTPNAGTLFDLMQRALLAAAEPDARKPVEQSDHPL